jgi:hypothetical protein
LKISKSRLFWLFAITQTLFALVIFINEVMAIYNRVPGGNYPIEHKSSWLKVIIFCSGAIASFLMIRLLGSKKNWGLLLPSPFLVLPLGIFSTLASTVFSHYLSIIGWCCEHPLSFYFGFPFSYLLGIGSFIYSEMQPYENYGLLKIIASTEPQVHWRFLPYEFFLSFLFWSNIIFVLLGLVLFFRQGNNLREQMKEEVQFESS